MADRTANHAATGRRKTAVARVRLLPGDGKVTVNRRSLDEYFGRPTLRMIVNQPFELTSTKGTYDVTVNVAGGGVSAQASAIRHGITRALMGLNPDFRPGLKKAGFVTRPQYSKR